MGKPDESSWAIDEILRFNANRKRELVAIKYARMADNVFAFFRGTNHLFADRWAQFRAPDAGPEILVCGDLHLENFGAYQSDDGEFHYDINDFDDALVAPAGVDAIRCTASTLLAAEVWGISAVQACGIALDFLSSYRGAVVDSVRSGNIGQVLLGQGEGPIWQLLGETASGDRAAMLDHQTQIDRDGQRRIRKSPDKHPEVGEKWVARVRTAVESHGRTTPNPGAFRVLDVAGRIAGIGSLGVRRFTVLVAGGDTPDSNRLLDVKQAVPSCALACSSGPQPDSSGNDAQRIVSAQRQLQSKPTAGLAAIDVDSVPYRLREMVPDENRSKLERLQNKPDKLRRAIRVAGQLAGWAAVRGCPGSARRKLADWCDSPALDSVLAAAVRCADLTMADFKDFSSAFASGQLDKHPKE